MTLAAARLAAWALFAVLWASLARADFLWNKIRNRSVAWGLAGGTAAYAVLAAMTVYGRGSYYEWAFYGTAAAYVGAAWAAALGFWLLRVWPAGDAKLFALLSFLFPLMDPMSPLLPLRAVLVSMMNIFLPAAVFVVLGGLRWVFRTRLLKRWEFARSLGPARWLAYQRERLLAAAEGLASLRAALAAAAREPGRAAWALAEWASFFAAAGLLVSLLPARLGSGPWMGLVLCAFSFFVWRALARLAGSRVLAAAFWCAAAVAWRLRPELPWREAAGAAANLAAFGAFVGAGMRLTVSWAGGGRALLWGLTALPVLLGVAGPWLRVPWPVLLTAVFLGAGLAAVHLNVSEDPCDWRASDLAPYLVLSPAALALIRRDKAFYEEHFSTRYADGLTPEQASALKAWCARNKVERVPLQRTLSFAFWIFGGFCLTALLKRDLLAVILGA